MECTYFFIEEISNGFQGTKIKAADNKAVGKSYLISFSL